MTFYFIPVNFINTYDETLLQIKKNKRLTFHANCTKSDTTYYYRLVSVHKMCFHIFNKHNCISRDICEVIYF